MSPRAAVGRHAAVSHNLDDCCVSCSIATENPNPYGSEPTPPMIALWSRPEGAQAAGLLLCSSPRCFCNGQTEVHCTVVREGKALRIVISDLGGRVGRRVLPVQAFSLGWPIPTIFYSSVSHLAPRGRDFCFLSAECVPVGIRIASGTGSTWNWLYSELRTSSSCSK